MLFGIPPDARDVQRITIFRDFEIFRFCTFILHLCYLAYLSDSHRRKYLFPISKLHEKLLFLHRESEDQMRWDLLESTHILRIIFVSYNFA